VSGEPACATVEPVDIEAPPYNGTWFDDLTEDTACACEVSTGTTDLYWTHYPSGTYWNSGNTGGVYDDDMDTFLIGPQIMVPSTNAIRFTYHFDSDIATGDAVTIGYKIDESPATMVLTQGGAVTDYDMVIALGGLPDDSVVSWVIEFESDAADNVGTACTLWDVTSEAYDPGPLPDINDGGAPDPANEICSTGALISFYNYYSSSNDYYYIYYYWIGSSMPVNWTWAGAVPPYFTIGDSGFMFPSLTVTTYGHRICEPDAIDLFFPYGDHQATCQFASATYNHADLAADCAGEVRHQVLDAGTSTERWVIQWCDVGQIGEADTTNWRVIFNGVNNANPNDMRIEIVDAGSRVNETSDDYTGAFMIYNGVYIPVQCDYTAWTDNMAIDIDQP